MKERRGEEKEVDKDREEESSGERRQDERRSETTRAGCD